LSSVLTCAVSREINFDKRTLNPGETATLLSSKFIRYGSVLSYGDGDPYIIVEIRIGTDTYIISGDVIFIEPVSERDVSISARNILDVPGSTPTISVTYVDWLA